MWRYWMFKVSYLLLVLLLFTVISESSWGGGLGTPVVYGIHKLDILEIKLILGIQLTLYDTQ